MNARERFVTVMNFEPVVSLKWEFGYWASTVRRWYREGLARKVGLPDHWPDGVGIHGGAAGWRPGRPLDRDVWETCGLDEGMQRILLNNFVFPPFPEEILEEQDRWILVRNEMGVIEKRLKEHNSLSSFLQGPISNWEDWEKFKFERLQPDLTGRLPAKWDELKSNYQQRTFPLAIGGGQGFFSTPRYLFGEMQVLTAFYDEPDLMHQIVADLADFWIQLYSQVLDQVNVDLALIWEDMCYNRGPLISPATFRAFLLPGYLKLSNFLKERGVQHILVDTDGDVWKLIPLFLEGGVTGLYPFEVRAGMDVVEVRKTFPKLQILGGIDKAVLTASPQAIESELQMIVPRMLSQSGYIPYVDHFVPPGVSWPNFLYYRKRLNELIEANGAN
jgi:uroporphyrinogen decarboxylase